MDEASLRRVVYDCRRHPFYELLLSDMRYLAWTTQGRDALLYERRFGQPSRFADWFVRDEAHSFDPSESAVLVGRPPDRQFQLVIVHNWLHHEIDPPRLFERLLRLTSPGGRLYVFDACHREIHQAPGHYVQFTPYGLATALERAGFDIMSIHDTGDALEAANYFLDQAGLDRVEEDPPGRQLAKPGGWCPTAYSVTARRP